MRKEKKYIYLNKYLFIYKSLLAPQKITNQRDNPPLDNIYTIF
jgi:hypothetical protein